MVQSRHSLGYNDKMSEQELLRQKMVARVSLGIALSILTIIFLCYIFQLIALYVSPWW